MKVYLVRAVMSLAEYDHLLPRLSAEERRRIALKHHHTDRVAALVSQLLQHTVANTITRDHNGKPRSEGALRFNTSHDGHWVALATSSSEVGVDLCAVRPHEPWMDDVSREYFGDFGDFGETRHDAREFATKWAMREAELKRLGVGVPFEGRVDTTRVKVSWVDDDTVCAAVSTDDDDEMQLVHWSISDLENHLKI